MLKKTFHHKQKGDEKQESDQDFVNAFVVGRMHLFVLSIDNNRGDYKTNEEQSGKNELSCAEHIFIFSAKVLIHPKTILCKNN